MARRRKITERKRAIYLKALAEGASYGEAAAKIGVTRQAVDWVRAHEPEFARRVAAARKTAASILEDTAWNRAVNGWEEPVYQGGKQVGTVRRFSDGNLQMLLKGY